MSKEEFIPLEYANTWRIRTNLSLPFGIEDRLGLNVRKVDSLCQIAGFKKITINNDSDSETSKAVVQTVGINLDGSAIGGGARMSTVPSHREKYNEGRGHYKSSQWADLNILFNTEEVKRRILDGNERVTEPKQWASELNKAIKDAILNAGAKHLTDVDLGNKILAYMVYGLQIGGNIFVKSSQASFENYLFNVASDVLLQGSIWHIFRTFREGREGQGQGSRATLFVGPELDRMVVLGVASQGKPLVKPLFDK